MDPKDGSLKIVSAGVLLHRFRSKRELTQAADGYRQIASDPGLVEVELHRMTQFLRNDFFDEIHAKAAPGRLGYRRPAPFFPNETSDVRFDQSPVYMDFASGTLSAPNLAALVASSCRAMPRDRASFGASSTSGPSR